VREYLGSPGEAGRVAFVPGEPPRLAAVAHEAVCLWEVGRPDPVASWPWEDVGDRSALITASADGRWLAVVPNAKVALCDLSVTGTGPVIKPALYGVLAVRFSGRPERLVLVRGPRSSEPSGLVVEPWTLPGPGQPFELTTITPIALADSGSPYPGNGPGWESKDLSADGRWFALSSREKAMHVWDAAGGSFRGTISLRGLPCGVAFAPDGSKLAIDAGTTVYVHDTATLGAICKWKTNYSYVPGLAWSPDGRLLARTDRSTTVRVYEAASGRQVMAVGAKRGILVSAAFSPDGLTLATGTRGGPVRVWDVE
jgi:WD40 repeat protein